jgi:hypothetical protein
MAVRIGSLFRWRDDALGIARGAAGVCYALTDDGQACILFESGIPAALSIVELNRYANWLGEAPALAAYRFDGLIQLLDDFDRGVFSIAFRRPPPAAAA